MKNNGLDLEKIKKSFQHERFSKRIEWRILPISKRIVNLIIKDTRKDA